MNEFNIYCDESCHLENDGEKVMVIGAVTCPTKETRQIADEIRDVKQKFGISRHFELKWTKVSPGKTDFYLALVDYFYKNPLLSFRALVIPDKTLLNHAAFGHSHDEWYYKMYFDMLKVIIEPESAYNIYIDIKDTCGVQKISKLHDVLCNNIYDFSRDIIRKIQQVHSHEVEQLQLADLFIGALKTAVLGKSESEAKKAIIERIKAASHYDLTRSTLLRESKTNILIWQANQNGGNHV